MIYLAAVLATLDLFFDKTYRAAKSQVEKSQIRCVCLILVDKLQISLNVNGLLQLVRAIQTYEILHS